jgi:Cdc6-like AAA superfamily ATPase
MADEGSEARFNYMAATLAPIRSGFAPSVPQTFEDLGISQSLVLDLVLRRLLLEGFSNLQSLSQSLRLSVPILSTVFSHMRQQQMIDVKGMIGNDYHFTLSQAGKTLAGERFQITQYAGAAPVCLKDYSAATKAQAAEVRIDRKALRSAFSDLVISDQLLDQLGPALISQNSIFIYGPTGNGKTSLAERMLRVYQDAILLPYSVEVDGQIISLYDPVVHQPLDVEDNDIDPRWVLCRRPCIVVGGELIPSMLELRLDESSGIYAAPLQMKANNGILIIDDFGRQLMSPRDLLNRWIVPLDRRVDYLMLRYGVKFQIPFELMVVFSTNLEPSDLADEAFLRRIHNKIFVDAVDDKAFDQIFHRVVGSFNIPCEPDSAEYLRKLCMREGRTELRACYPADICNILTSIGKYEGRPPHMSKSELERASALYFAKG